MADPAIAQTTHSPNPVRFFNDRVEMELTLGRVVVFDLADYDLLRPYRWFAVGRKTYAAAMIGGVRVTMQRFLLRPGPGLVPDHRDGDGLNNTRSNLRTATETQNKQNRRVNRNSSHGVKGVSRHKNGWVARVQANGKRVRLGYFETIELAGDAYRDAARCLHGEFYREPQ